MMTSLFVKITGYVGDFFLDFEHEFNTSGITVLYGSNGSGKSTIISVLSGFINHLETKIVLNDKSIENTKIFPPHKRPFGTMFQNPILFEHMSVSQNLDYPIKRNKSLDQTLLSKEELINYLELGSLLNRYPQNLSGGEKLRVALARTILKQSDYLLLDEPMSDLDIKTKARLLNFLKMINKKFKIPILYVSHSIEEISQIADEIILIKNGKKIITGSVSKILNSNSFQRLIGKFESSSVLEGILIKTDQLMNMTTLDVNGQTLIVPGRPGLMDKIVRVRIRSRDIIVSPVKINTHITENELEGIITKIYTEKDTAFSELVIKLMKSKIKKTSQTLRARITTYNSNKMKIAENKKVFIYISSVSIDRQTYKY